MKILKIYFVLPALFAACLFIANTQAIFGQSDAKAFRYFTPQEGFPSFVYRLEQGEKGKIWIIGLSGLVSFDGYETKVYTPDPSDSTSISDGIITGVLIDNNGHLWLLGENGVSIYDFDTESFSKASIPDSLPPYRRGRGVIQTSDSLVWIGADDGLYSFTTPTSEKPMPRVSYFEIEGLEGNSKRVNDLIEGPDGKLWISSNKGLYFLDPRSGVATKAGPLNQIPDGVDFSYRTQMVMDNDNTVWVNLEGGLLRFTEGAKEPEFLSTLGEDNFSLEGVQTTSLTLASDGSIWMGTFFNGALRYHPTTNKLAQYTSDTNNRESISENTVRDILEDMDGNIWFSHIGNGMSMMYDKAWNYTFKKITETDDINSNFIYDLEPDANDNIWAATRNGLDFIPIDGGSNQVFTPISNTYVDPDQRWFTTILPSGKDDLFLIERTNEAGNWLHQFDKKELRFTDVQAIDSLAFMSSFVSDGTTLYWTIRGESKLMMLNPDDLSTTTIDLPLAFPEVVNNADTTLYVTPMVSKLKDLYLQYNYEFKNERSVSERRYFKLDQELQSFSEVPMRLPDSKRSIKMDRRSLVSQKQDGVFYTRTNVGLLKEDVSTGQSSLIISESAAKDYLIGSLLEDQQGNLWYSDIGSTLSKLDIHTTREQSFAMDMNRKPKWISETAELSNGDIIFGGLGGYIQFNPSEIREELNIQKLFIDEFRTGATYYTNLNPEEEYAVEYEDNNLSFRFVGINFRSADTRYRYRLIGYEEDWVDLGTQRSIFFANLPFGEYKFQVQATTGRSSFRDNSATADVQFTILAPWYRTWWAYGFYAILLISGIVAADRIQRKRIQQKEQEKTREKELAHAKEIEKAYKNLEVAHENLRSTQSQLIQSEKMASLGELTAGIAHEIQNPLNFVNNFSEVSSELLIELKEELGKGDVDEAKAISDDVIQNLEKITHHGKRADAIVKGMLAHSRTGKGEKEPTDINNLAEEYLKLSYHGLRAKDKSFNADFKTDFDPDLPKVNVVPQDIGRVLLNLINNAFQACNERSKKGEPDYIPTLTVKTELTANGQQLIAISDNGPGIPDSIKDKIFQPFFTTKPTGQGTGLGLSLSYDIVKAHGGELRVETKEGEGTEFIIILPLNE